MAAIEVVHRALRAARQVSRRRAGFLYRLFMIPVRTAVGLRYSVANFAHVLSWAIRSREDTNFTYDLTEANLHDLAHTVAIACGSTPAQCFAFMCEAHNDNELRRHVVETTRSSAVWASADPEARFARRLGWYALVRVMRPRVVVETGVDKGLGSVLLCSALLRNVAEGYPGYYYGTEINPEAGWLLHGRYAEVGRVLYGDSVESLRQLKEQVDLFINDSDHSEIYERMEYDVIAPKLSERGLILSDNAHASSALREFSEQHGRSYLYFQERPSRHWYPGAGIGLSFKASS